MCPQAVQLPLTGCATFLVLAVNSQSPSSYRSIRSALGTVSDLVKNVAIRDRFADVSATVGIGASAWDRLTGLRRPAELHEFVAVKGPRHTAPSTAGDLFFHIRSERRDMCFELERQLLQQLGSSVTVLDETTGFRYFDTRDLLGFVDGTANPVGPGVPESVLITPQEDASAAGGTYVVLQKYMHDLQSWNALSTEEQERIIGRKKFDNVELPDAQPDAQKPHKQLATITDDQGNECAILRDNMPFGSPGKGEYGTYFIGYSRRLWVIEQMIKRMFVGEPAGKHDRILDYSKAVTGHVFFVPSSDMLETIGDC